MSLEPFDYKASALPTELTGYSYNYSLYYFDDIFFNQFSMMIFINC